MKFVTQRDGDLSTYFDKVHESEAGIKISSLKQILINSHTEHNRGLIRGHLPLEHIFGFCRSYEKINERLRFELKLQNITRKQDVLSTKLGDKTVDVTNNCVHLYIPTIMPCPETRRIFNRVFTKSFTLSNK